MIIGIDLGTTNSLVACFRDGKAEVIPNRLGKLLTPSVISIDEEGNMMVGETAREYGLMHPLSTAAVFKRSMGTEKEFVLGKHHLRAEELSGLLLKSLKEDAESFLGETVDEAIISVPAYFNDKQRTATKKAGELAGLTVQRIINEPTAAALACGAGNSEDDETCLVFDLGGGTFDVSILEFSGNIIEVHAVAGDNFLGGEDFTEALASLFLKKTGLEQASLTLDELVRLKKAAEACKCAFASDVSPVMKLAAGDKTHECVIPYYEYTESCKDLLDKLRKPIERSIRDAGVKLSDIDRLVLVGGATRLPLIKTFAANLFHRLPALNTDPDLSVAIGAAMTCAMKERRKEFKEVVLTDICPFTLGTAVSHFNGYFEEGDHYLPIIERNTVIPVSRTQTVYTAYDNQNAVTVKILQGESRKASSNLLLGELNVSVPPGPKGKESIDITYTYDVNSILEVQVHVLSTGLKKKVIIKGAGNTMTDEELEARFKELAFLKRVPKDEEENRLLVLRGERLFEETLDMDRVRIDMALSAFQAALNRQEPAQIEKTRKELKDLLDSIESSL